MFFLHDFYVNISCIHRLNGSWCSVRALLIEMVLGLPLCILCMTQIFSNARLYLKLKTTTYVLLFLSIFSAKASFANKPPKGNFFYSNSSTITSKRFKIADTPNPQFGNRFLVRYHKKKTRVQCAHFEALMRFGSAKKIALLFTLFKFLMSVFGLFITLHFTEKIKFQEMTTTYNKL